jgi:hypothetical protein
MGAESSKQKKLEEGLWAVPYFRLEANRKELNDPNVQKDLNIQTSQAI